jgi:hypothetical protein
MSSLRRVRPVADRKQRIEIRGQRNLQANAQRSTPNVQRPIEDDTGQRPEIGDQAAEGGHRPEITLRITGCAIAGKSGRNSQPYND